MQNIPEKELDEVGYDKTLCSWSSPSIHSFLLRQHEKLLTSLQSPISVKLRLGLLHWMVKEIVQHDEMIVTSNEILFLLMSYKGSNVSEIHISHALFNSIQIFSTFQSELPLFRILGFPRFDLICSKSPMLMQIVVKINQCIPKTSACFGILLPSCRG